MNLKTAVEKYLAVTQFGQPMPLTAFGLDRNATEAMLAAWEEDYQLHRHMELIPAEPTGPGGENRENREGREGTLETAAQTRYFVAGIAYISIVFRASIRDIIGSSFSDRNFG